jgi:tetratricopeptide (TPR) repeat protein
MKTNISKYVYSIICILILSAISSIKLFSATNDEIFSQANKKYKSGDYQGALNEYLKIENSGMESAELYYNIGDAYYKINAYPKAILYFERAKKINPADKDIEMNIRVANSKIIDRINTIEPFFLYRLALDSANMFSARAWAILFVSLLSVASILYIATIYNKKRIIKKSAFLVASLSLFLAICTLGLGLYRGHLQNKKDSAIVTNFTGEVKFGPDPAAKVNFVLHEGTKISIVENKDNWIKIRISDGREGWLQKQDMTII